MSRYLVRLAVFLLVALAAGGAWWLWLRASPNVGSPAKERLYTADQDKVAALHVEAGSASASFVRTEGGWQFADSPLAVNLDRWGGIVLLLTGPEVERILDTPGDLAAYGFDNPSGVVRVSLDGREDVVILIGDVTPDDEHHYVRLDGDDRVQLVNAPWGRALLGLALSPPYPYWYYHIDASLVHLFEVQQGDRVVTFLLGLPAEGPASNRVVVGDSARDATPEEVSLLKKLVGGPPGLGIVPAVQLPTDIAVDDPLVIRLSYALARPLETRSTYSTIYEVGQVWGDGSGYVVTTQDTEDALVFDAAWVRTVQGLLTTTGE